MQNRCKSEYVIEGDTNEVKKLYKLMNELKNRREPLVKNSFGMTFPGCLLAALGYEWYSVNCQGAWYNLEKKGNTLQFTVETILSPRPVVFNLVCRKFPFLTNYYRAENPATVLFETNDSEGKYFPEKYRVELSSPQDEFMMKYFVELPTVFEWLGKANSLLTGRSYSRREQHEEIERDCMGPLNPICFELERRHVATVQGNGYVRLENHYYSVPYRHTGKKVNILYNSEKVEIYLRYEKVALHQRGYKQYGYPHDEAHLAPSQKAPVDWDPGQYITEAASMRPDVEDYIRHVIEAKVHPEQTCKSCCGILNFASRVGPKRLVNACRWASNHGLYTYPGIEEILKNRQDELPLEENEDDNGQKRMPAHENIRGKEYYN